MLFVRPRRTRELDATDGFDSAIIEGVRNPGVSNLLAFLGPLTEAGSTGAVAIVAVLTFAVGAAIGPWRHGLIGAVTIGAAALGVELVKAFVARADRTSWSRSSSSTGSASRPGTRPCRWWRTECWRSSSVGRGCRAGRPGAIVALALLVVPIGVSRIWLGVHYPTDVIAGWTAGWVIEQAYAAFTRGVSREPAAAAADADPAAQRSDRPAAG